MNGEFLNDELRMTPEPVVARSAFSLANEGSKTERSGIDDPGFHDPDYCISDGMRTTPQPLKITNPQAFEQAAQVEASVEGRELVIVYERGGEPIDSFGDGMAFA